jgi:hypothetical protein
VSVSAKVTLGIPVITDTDTASDAAPDVASDAVPKPSPAATGPRQDVADEYAPGVGGQGVGAAFRISTMFSGCEIPGIGVIDADTIETLLQTVPLQVGRGAARCPHRDRAGDQHHRVPPDPGHQRLRGHP